MNIHLKCLTRQCLLEIGSRVVHACGDSWSKTTSSLVCSPHQAFWHSVCTCVHLTVHAGVLLCVCASVGACNYNNGVPDTCLQCTLYFYFRQETDAVGQQCDCHIWLHNITGCSIHLPVYFQHYPVQSGPQFPRYGLQSFISNTLYCIKHFVKVH